MSPPGQTQAAGAGDCELFLNVFAIKPQSAAAQQGPAQLHGQDATPWGKRPLEPAFVMPVGHRVSHKSKMLNMERGHMRSDGAWSNLLYRKVSLPLAGG